MHFNSRIRLIILLTLVLSLSIFITSCKYDMWVDLSPNPTEEATENKKDDTVINTGNYTLDYVFPNEKTEELLEENGTTIIKLNDSFAEILGQGATFEDNILTIDKEGTYVLSGSLKNGQVYIDASKSDTIHLVLNGVDIKNNKGTAIYSPKAQKVVLVLEEGTHNTIEDGSDYLKTGEDDPDAAIYIKNDLSIMGEGKLTVTGNYKHGIRTQDFLTITSGTITVTAKGDALRGRDGIAIQDGNFTLIAGGDGMQSNNDTDDSKGFIIIQGGSFNIKAQNDGIQAKSSLTISAGIFEIITGGGSANAPTRGNSFTNRGPGGNRGNPNQSSSITTESMKGLKAGKLINITGGSLTIDAEDDGIHSNSLITISGGSINIKTGDDGIHGDENINITDGNIVIERSYEGIESSTIDISGGTISIIASDDGINASDGSSRSGPGNSNNSLYIRISGGDITVDSQGDGIDSNGKIFIEGGNIYIVGSSDPESAVDADGTILVSGGRLVGIGSVGHREAPSESSAQPSLMTIFSSEQAGGSIIKLTDTQGNILFEGTSSKRFQSFLFTDSALVKGGQYKLYVNGIEKSTITLSTGITMVSETGGKVSSGGNMGGPGRR